MCADSSVPNSRNHNKLIYAPDCPICGHSMIPVAHFLWFGPEPRRAGPVIMACTNVTNHCPGLLRAPDWYLNAAADRAGEDSHD